MSGLSRREFLKFSIASALGLGAYFITREPAAPAKTEAPKLIFPEELKQLLDGWMDNQYQYNDYDSLKPLEDYVKRLHETSPVGGWKEVESQPSLKIWVGDSKSPELLKDSGAVFFKTGDKLRGFIWNNDSTYSLQGEGQDPVYGTMAHFSGEVQNNYEGEYTAQRPIPSDAPFLFFIDWKGPNKFSGHIYFRSHDRPFGGGKDKDSFPDNING